LNSPFFAIGRASKNIDGRGINPFNSAVRLPNSSCAGSPKIARPGLNLVRLKNPPTSMETG